MTLSETRQPKGRAPTAKASGKPAVFVDGAAGTTGLGIAERLRQLNAPSVTFTPTITISLAALGFPPHQRNDVDAPAPGWNAVGVTHWKLNRMGLPFGDTAFWQHLTKGGLPIGDCPGLVQKHRIQAPQCFKIDAALNDRTKPRGASIGAT